MTGWPHSLFVKTGLQYKQESQMAYGTVESFPGVYVFGIDIMNNLTIFAGKPRKQRYLNIGITFLGKWSFVSHLMLSS